jgi:very-short-patch-repair endonuclease
VLLGPETGALLSVRDQAVLSHHSAAALWEIGPADSRGQVHILLEGGWAGRRRGVRIHRTAVLDARDIRIRHGLPVTSPARTLLDQAGICTERQLERLFTEAIVQHLVTPADLEDVIARGRGRTGRRVLRALLDDELDPTLNRSDGEQRMMALIRMAQLPEPIVYAKLYGFEADFYWPAHRVVVEVDSYGFHTTHWAYERDCRKDAVLRAHGLPPLRFSWRQIAEDPFVVIAQVAEAIARGGPPPA